MISFQKKAKNMLLLALCLGVLGAGMAQASPWQFEQTEPGAGVWVHTETQERVEAFLGDPAPDGSAHVLTPGGAQSEVPNPSGGSTLPVDASQNPAKLQGGQTAPVSGAGQSGSEAPQNGVYEAPGEIGPGMPQPGMNQDGNTGENAGKTEAVQTDSASGQNGSAEVQGNGAAAENNAETAAQENAAEQSGQSADAQNHAENPNLVFSNGRWLDVTKPMVALTYDDGPYPAVGNIIMDEMAKVNGRATFFMVGNRVAANKTELQRMVAEGHEVANHSWDHQYFNKIGAAAIRSQVAKANEAIAAASGVTPKLIRLPGGNITQTVRENVDMPMIYWSIDTLDWKTKNAQKTIDAVVGKVKDGDIVLMHEIWKQTGEANKTIIPTLAAQGFQLVTVSELAQYRGHSLGLGRQYSSFR